MVNGFPRTKVCAGMEAFRDALLAARFHSSASGRNSRSTLLGRIANDTPNTSLVEVCVLKAYFYLFYERASEFAGP